jgi:hypothetical protein
MLSRIDKRNVPIHQIIKNLQIGKESAKMKFQEMYEESAFNSFIYQLDSPCACRADPRLDSVLRSLNAGKTSGVFEGLQFYYPQDADDYYDMKKEN